MLRPANGVADRAGLLAPRGAGENIRDFEEALLRNAARLLDHLGRVAREVALQHLENAARMLQRFVAMRLVQLLRFAAAILPLPSPSGRHPWLLRRFRAFVKPRGRVVLFLLRIPAAE